MKRMLAIALAAGALLLGGCSGPHAGASSPAPTSSPAAVAHAHRDSGTPGQAAAPAAASSASAADDDVSDLLDQVDQQLQTTDQPPSEQD